MLYHVSGYVGCAGVPRSVRGKEQKQFRGRESALDTRATRRPPVHTERGGRGLDSFICSPDCQYMVTCGTIRMGSRDCWCCPCGVRDNGVSRSYSRTETHGSYMIPIFWPTLEGEVLSAAARFKGARRGTTNRGEGRG